MGKNIWNSLNKFRILRVRLLKFKIIPSAVRLRNIFCIITNFYKLSSTHADKHPFIHTHKGNVHKWRHKRGKATHVGFSFVLSWRRGGGGGCQKVEKVAWRHLPTFPPQNVIHISEMKRKYLLLSTEKSFKHSKNERDSVVLQDLAHTKSHSRLLPSPKTFC